MRINTNVASLTALEANKNMNKNLETSLSKLSSGLKINKAGDDASGLAIADKLRTQASSIKQGLANANSAVAMIQIADKAMSEQSNILDVVKQKLIQAATSTTSAEGREAVRKDIVKLLDQFDMIASQTNYNGQYLLQKSDTDTAVQDTFTFQLGEDKSFDVTSTPTNASNTSGLGGGSDTITSGTNLLGNDSIKLKDTANTITLQTKIKDLDGSETVSSVTATQFSIQFTGNLGSIANFATGNTVIDLSSQTQSVKDLALAYAGTDATEGFSQASYDTTTMQLTIISSASLDFSVLNLSNATITQDSTSLNGIKIDSSTGFSITNNNSATVGTEPFIDITTDSGSDTITGGELLSSIKNLATDGLTNAKANSYMETIDEAITQLNTIRADFGSSQQQLESSIRNMQTTHTNLKNAESVIRDVDYAEESANFNKSNIIAQAGTYAISQANNVQQNVLKLLQ